MGNHSIPKRGYVTIEVISNSYFPVARDLWQHKLPESSGYVHCYSAKRELGLGRHLDALLSSRRERRNGADSGTESHRASCNGREDEATLHCT